MAVVGKSKHKNDNLFYYEKSKVSEKEEKVEEKPYSTMVCKIMVFVTFLKVLLIPTYHSTDFEVHRNWLAITHSLPIRQWYTENTSIWTLDYPPLFAWFQLLLSYPAVYFDPQMLVVKNLNYKSQETILYMRLTVIVCDLLLAYGTKECCDYLSSSGVRKSSKWSSRWYSPIAVLQFLLLCNAGLLIVDNIHFQYNGALFGLFLLSVSSMLQGHHLKSAFYFSVLLNMKHIFLYMSPVYFIYLLRNTCFTDLTPGYIVKPSSFQRGKFLRLAAIVIFVFTISLGPFILLGQSTQLIARLFPFRRGLFHSYWAPNIWALYSTLDKTLEMLARLLGINVPSSTITLGLTVDASYSVLPNVTPFVTFLLTAIFAAPCLIKLWRFPGNPLHFVRCLVLCALTSFLFGWHVHEKAILMALVPLIVLAVIWQSEARTFFLLSITGYFSLLPLLPPGIETPIKYGLLGAHVIYACFFLARLYAEEVKLFQLPLLTKIESFYILGLVPVGIATMAIPHLFPRLMFLPMLITSAYCSVGIIYSWGLYYVYFMTKHEANHKRKLH